MGAFTRLGLLAAASALIAGADAAYQVKFKLFNSTGADATGTWVSNAIDSGNFNTEYHIRVFRDDGGAIAGCTFNAAKVILNFAPTAATVAPDLTGAASFEGSYWKLPIKLLHNTDVGSYPISDDGATLTCNGVDSTAYGSPISGFLNIGYGATFTFNDGNTAKSGLLKLDGTVSTNPTMIATIATGANFVISSGGTGAALNSPTPTAALFELPESWSNVVTVAYDSGNSLATTIVFTLTGFSSLPYGVYDIGLRPGMLTAATGVMNAPRRIRILWGSPVVISNAVTLRPSPQRDTSNSTHLFFAVNTTRIGINQFFGANTHPSVVSGGFLSGVYDKLMPYTSGFSGFDVTSLMNGLDTVTTSLFSTSAPAYANFTYTTLLSDGWYTLKRKTTGGPVALITSQAQIQDIVLIIDRTPPVATNATWTGTAQVIGRSGNVKIPNTMFTDKESSSPRWLRLVSHRFIGSDGNGFFCTNQASLSSAFCLAPTIRGPATSVLVELVVSDEAGNQAVGFLTIPVVAAPTVSITVADKRNVFVSDSMRTGGTNSQVSSKIQLTVVATFSEPIFDTGANALASTDLNVVTSGTVVVTGPVYSGGNRVLTFTVRETSVSTDTDIVIKLNAGKGTRASDSVATRVDSNTVTVYVDKNPLATGNTLAYMPAQAYAAGVNMPYFEYLPIVLFQDTGSGYYKSAAEKIKITAASTNQNVGLAVTLGPQGRAYISGTATSKPSTSTEATDCFVAKVNVATNWVKFSLTAEDEAGNTLSGFYCVEVVDTLPLTSSLSFNRNTLKYDEDATAVALDASASFTASSTVSKMFVYLETVDAVGGSPLEVLTLPGVGTPVAYAALSGTTMTGITSTSGTLTAAQVTTGLNSLTYANTIATLTPGFRTVRIVITKTNTLEVVVGVTSKTIYVSNINDVPTLTVAGGAGTAIATVTFTETLAFWTAGQNLVTATQYLTLADSDDDGFTVATVAMATTSDGTNYGACDSSRDLLYLPSGYLDAPSVAGSWNPATCTLTLRSFTGLTATKAEMMAALHAIQYRNKDNYNPANWVVPASYKLKRSIVIRVTDAASAGRAAAPATTADVTTTINPTWINHTPFFIWEKLYGPGGMLYNTNQTTNVKNDFQPAVTVNLATSPQRGAPDMLTIRKFSMEFDDGNKAAARLTIPLDFSKVASMDGVLANGALIDLDTVTPTLPAAGVITLALFDSAGTTLTTTSTAPDFKGDLGVAPNDWDAATGKGKIVIDGHSSMVAGSYRLDVTFGTFGVFSVWFDIRRKVCFLDASNFLSSSVIATAAAAAAATTKFIHDPNLCASLTANYKATVSAAPSPYPGTLADYYKKGTTVMLPGKQATETDENDGTVAKPLRYLGVAAGGVFNTHFNFYTFNRSLAGLRHDMIRAGVVGEEATSRLASMRGQARGMASFYIPEDSFATTSGTFDFKFNPIGQYQANTLPAGNPGEILDANLVFELTPSCMQFAKPLRACVFVGDTPAGYTRSIKVSSQRDCTDSTKGWTAWESLSGVTFDLSTGLICGNTSHFSALGTFLTPLGKSPTESKAISMGGSCPNDCSGHGYCRSNGKCQCWSGYNGNDCSARTCPVAESWDGGDFSVHQLKECAERGVCNPKTGQCACYPGFEGSACQRTACPNGCSGHGQCKLLKDLPKVQATGYKKWETDRLQKCVCDFGYTGLDCSERICPFGDDPETTCNDKRQIQQVKLDFGSLPGDAITFGLFDTDELALNFRSYFGQNLSIPRVVDVFDASGAGAINLQRSLKSLPGFAVSDVSVTASVASDYTSATYNVTFDGASLAVALAGSASARLTATGNTVPGNQAMLVCPVNSYGSLGCQSAGCRPKYKQARLLSQPTSQVRVSATSILRQPQAKTSGISTVGKWGVVATVVIANRVETGEQTYAVNTTIYGYDDGESVAETPLPPANSPLRSSVALPYGLEVDFDSGVLVTGTYQIKWRLPTCTVTQVQAASDELELAECSRRGHCERSSGQCKCFAGYSGANCGMQTVIV